MIRLICIDVDGTLIGTAGNVLPEVWQAVDRARERGIRLAIASGRPAFGVTREYADRLDADGWHIFQNGASVVHLPTHRSRSAALPLDSVEMLIKRARNIGRLLELYTDEDYTSEGDPVRARQHAELLGVPYTGRRFETLNGTIVRGQWLVPHTESKWVLAEPHEGLTLSPSTAPLMPDTLFVNLTREGTDKSSAVRTVAEEYGFALEEVMFVGDGHNDMTAMQLVGCGVAMANAEPEVRAVARHVVPHVDAAGLAEAIEIAFQG